MVCMYYDAQYPYVSMLQVISVFLREVLLKANSESYGTLTNYGDGQVKASRVERTSKELQAEASCFRYKMFYGDTF